MVSILPVPITQESNIYAPSVPLVVSIATLAGFESVVSFALISFE